MPYRVILDVFAQRRYEALDRSIQERLNKKLTQLELDWHRSRHLQHGRPEFVEEVSGYRICFLLDEARKIKNITFMGSHKDYLKWLRKRTLDPAEPSD